MHGRARVPALPPSGEIDNGRTEAALVSQSGNSNCHKSCLLKDGGRRPAFTGSDAADEWATSEVSRSGCPLADETLAQMSARAADRIWSQRGAGRFAGEKLEAVIGVEPMMEVLQSSRPNWPDYVSLCEPIRLLCATADSAVLQHFHGVPVAHIRRFRLTYEETRM